MDGMESYPTILTKEEFKKINTAFQKLVDYSSRIYDLTTKTMYELERARKQTTKKYKQCLNKLKILKQKETRILSNIGPNIDIEDFQNYIDSYIYNDIPDEIKREYVTKRIMNVVNEMTLVSDEFLTDEDIQQIQRGIEYLNDLHLSFLKKISSLCSKTPRLMKFKYQLAFTNPKIETELLYSGFQGKNIITLSKNNKNELYNIDQDTYETELFEIYYDYFCDILNTIVEESTKENFDKNKVKNYLNLLEFINKQTLTNDLIIIKQEILDDLENDTTGILYQDVSVLERLLEIVETELNKRSDYDNTKTFNQAIFGTAEEGEIEFEESISEDQVNNIFDLIKQVTKTYNIGMELCELEKQNKKETEKFKQTIKLLKESTEKEKEYAKQITSVETVGEIIDTCLNIITGIEPQNINTLENICSSETIDNRYEVIKQRIINLLPELYFIDTSVYKSSDVPRFILQAHLIKVLRIFEEIIKENKNANSPLITVKYEEILANEDLTEDFINANGQIKRMLLLDDETLSTILEIDIDEFTFDKCELLNNYIAVSIENILEFQIQDPTELEKARLLFAGTYIDIAADELLNNNIDTPNSQIEKTYQKTK